MSDGASAPIGVAAAIVRLLMLVVFFGATCVAAIVALVFCLTGRWDYSFKQLRALDRVMASLVPSMSGLLTVSAECATGDGARAPLRYVLGKLEKDHCIINLLREIGLLRSVLADKEITKGEWELETERVR